DSLENRGIVNTRINFGIVRGLDYYSGIVFEVFDKNSTLGALAGGGRYDSLTKAFGREDIGATGVAGGVERIILTMQEQGIILETKQIRISVLYINEEMQKVAMSITSLLRLNNIPTNVDLSGKNLKKQIEQASESKYCIIVAPKELEQSKVVLRNMQDGTESQIDIEQLTDDPRSILNLEKH
ncbi:MAG: ATP phosphoribosyltransferase regulatory subunit, partial [Thermoproteota archaeon]